MHPQERRAVISLAGIISLRMFGLFMLLPVLALYSESLPGNTPMLMGWALGVYGLTQALMQIPFGLLYGRIDPKLTIAIGLAVFASGSVLAAVAGTIHELIAGRALQGAGAVSAAVMAMASDLTRSNQRTKAMAVIGISIGAAFVASLLIAPALQGWIGVKGMFWGIASLAGVAIAILYLLVPVVERRPLADRAARPVSRELSASVRNRQLMHMNIGIFLSHMALTAMFLVVPSLLRDVMLIPLPDHWKVYLLVLLLSAPGFLLAVRMTASGSHVMRLYRSAILVVAAGFMLLAAGSGGSAAGIVVALAVFFTGFNVLESMMPSLASRMTDASGRGGALSIYNTFQYLGIFAGGVVGGMVLDAFGTVGLLWCLAGVSGSWLALTMVQPALSLRETLEVELDMAHDSIPPDLVDRIGRLSGVESVTLASGRSVAFLEVDPSRYNSAELHELLNT